MVECLVDLFKNEVNFLSCNPSFGRIAYKCSDSVDIHEVTVLAVLKYAWKSINLILIVQKV